MAGPLTSGAAEDLLGLRSSRFWGETIFVHEFSHNVLAAIRAVDVHAPVSATQVIIPNVIGTGVDVIASRDMPEVRDGN